MSGSDDSPPNDPATAIRLAETRQVLLTGCWKVCRVGNRFLLGLYLLALILMFLCLNFVGEHSIFFAFLLYVPPSLWFLPVFPFLGASMVLLDWKAMVVTVVVAGAVMTLGIGCNFRGRSRPGTASGDGRLVLTLLTNNRGQDNGQSPKAFMKTMAPDVMAFQESPGTPASYHNDADYAAFPYVQFAGEFSLLSKYPIRSAEAISLPAPFANPNTSSDTFWPSVAARFVVSVSGHDIAIYNVHASSAREALRYYQRGAFLYGVLGLVPGTPWAAKRKSSQRYWDLRTQVIEALLKRAQEDPLPTVLMGDFNMPQLGSLYREVRNAFLDTHAIAGSGFGFTFPGVTRNPLSLGGPWMRIDYIFAAPGKWKVLWSATEKDRPSQHVATCCGLMLY